MQETNIANKPIGAGGESCLLNPLKDHSKSMTELQKQDKTHNIADKRIDSTIDPGNNSKDHSKSLSSCHKPTNEELPKEVETISVSSKALQNKTDKPIDARGDHHSTDSGENSKDRSNSNTNHPERSNEELQKEVETLSVSSKALQNKMRNIAEEHARRESYLLQQIRILQKNKEERQERESELLKIIKSLESHVDNMTIQHTKQMGEIFELKCKNNDLQKRLQDIPTETIHTIEMNQSNHSTNSSRSVALFSLKEDPPVSAGPTSPKSSTAHMNLDRIARIRDVSSPTPSVGAKRKRRIESDDSEFDDSDEFASDTVPQDSRGRLENKDSDANTPSEDDHVPPHSEDKRWMEMYKRLVEYKKTFGTTSVPRTSKLDDKLGLWVKTQRQYCKRQDRRDLLNKIDFEWSVINCEDRWMEMFDCLVAYKKEHGTTHVSRSSKSYAELGTWVATQRQGCTRSDRRELLESIGFQWSSRKSAEDQKWMEMYSRLVAYKEKHGTTGVPQNSKTNPKLGRWVKTQRQRCINQDRKELLDAIGFEWQSAVVEDKWMEMYKQLLAYKEKHGTTCVPCQYPKLGTWVRAQRQKCKSKKRRDLLDEIGFVWRIYSTTTPRKKARSSLAAPAGAGGSKRNQDRKDEFFKNSPAVFAM